MTDKTITAEIIIPAIVAITDRAGNEAVIDFTNLPPETLVSILIDAIDYGLTQKVNDGASSALDASLPAGSDDWDAATRRAWAKDNPDKVAQTRKEMRQRVADQISAGEWGIRRATATPADPVDTYRLQVAKEFLSMESSAAKLSYKAYMDIPAKDQAARRAYKLDMVKGHDALEKIAQDRHDQFLAFGNL